MNKIPIIVLLILNVFGTLSYSQVRDFKFRQEMHGIVDEWHKINLSDQAYSLIDPAGKDIRIIGVSDRDTVSIPFLLNTGRQAPVYEQEAFQIINQSYIKDRYFFTIKTADSLEINSFHLEFENSNFDWKIDLEGSHDQLQWFGLLKQYRILSIRNDFTKYSYTTLNFPRSDYRYFRISIQTDQVPNLKYVFIRDLKEGRNDPVNYNFHLLEENKTSFKGQNQTKIIATLNNWVPVSRIRLETSASIDYFRQIRFEFLKDSVETDKGWKEIYRLEGSGILSSLEDPEFHFNNIITSKIRITINHLDNEPLDFNIASISGYPYTLIARFNEPLERSFLLFGNLKAQAPEFDLKHFENTIPENPKLLKLGPIVSIQDTRYEKSPFGNYLMNGIIVLIVLILIVFTIRMIRERSTSS